MARTPRTPGVTAPAPEPITEVKRTAEDELPNAVDIDATKIAGPVLTKQGWVVPAELPRAPLR